ncbi:MULTISPECIES: ribosome silencing factor [Ornithinimicrobium]|uniref:Ribosomal silencing factor RsfS n=1 Tax=Ornithinimicrobium kibberense TaxID=282060 RepID=A0ABV5UYP9_9MICO|nr:MULTISPECIES: ribosome silencing factor [Ornithinimicrobium]OLT20944.1 ribosome silencing factor [Ornithinimicrobium sp. CNJ-824]
MSATPRATPRAVELAQAAAAAAQDKLARDVVGLDVSGQLALTDVFVIASAPSERQVGAVVDAVEDRLKELGAKPLRREGQREGRWVLLDFGDIVVHVMHSEDREFYDLERLWKDCPTVVLPPAPADEA